METNFGREKSSTITFSAMHEEQDDTKKILGSITYIISEGGALLLLSHVDRFTL